jgi:hypothetical protein
MIEPLQLLTTSPLQKLRSRETRGNRTLAPGEGRPRMSRVVTMVTLVVRSGSLVFGRV